MIVSLTVKGTIYAITKAAKRKAKKAAKNAAKKAVSKAVGPLGIIWSIVQLTLGVGLITAGVAWFADALLITVLTMGSGFMAFAPAIFIILEGIPWVIGGLRGIFAMIGGIAKQAVSAGGGKENIQAIKGKMTNIATNQSPANDASATQQDQPSPESAAKPNSSGMINSTVGHSAPTMSAPAVSKIKAA